MHHFNNDLIWVSLVMALALTSFSSHYTIKDTNSTVSAQFNHLTLTPPPSNCQSPDSLVLANFYNATNTSDICWTTEWNLDECITTWEELVLNDNCRVIELYLTENELCNTIPAEIGNLEELTLLKLNGNNLIGNIPPEISQLQQLTFLDLDHNNLTGEIPPEIGNMAALQILDLWNNQLTGIIPVEIGQLSQLTHLELADNHLSGSIPNEIENLVQLEVFDISVNDVGGTIPSEFNDLNQLKVLDLWGNRLIGNIPSLLSLEQLEYAQFADNRLTGTVPDFRNAPLKRLWLSLNQLDSLPPFMWEISTLGNQADEGLQIDENNFTFDDILPNMPIQDFANFIYAPQRKFYQDTLITRVEGENLTIDLGIDAGIDSHSGIFQNSSPNEYRWYQDGNLVATTDVNSLSFNPIQASDAGTYEVKVTNPDAPDLELCSHLIRIVVEPWIPTNTCGEEGYADLRFPDINNPNLVMTNGSIDNITWPGYANFNITYTVEGTANIKGFRSNGYLNNDGIWDHLTNADYTAEFQNLNYDNSNDIPALLVETQAGQETVSTYHFPDNPAYFDLLIGDVDDSDKVLIEVRDANNNLIVLNTPLLGHLAAAMPATPPIWNVTESSLTSPANAESYVNYAIFRFENQPVSSITLRFTGPAQSNCEIGTSATCAHFYTSLYARNIEQESVITELSATICEGESFEVGTSTYSQTGMFVDTLTSSNGCDSIVHLDLTVADTPSTSERTETSCSNTVNLIANLPNGFTGEWTNPNDPSFSSTMPETSINNLEEGEHQFIWSLYQENCLQAQDIVTIIYQSINVQIDTLLTQGTCIEIGGMTFCEPIDTSFMIAADCDTLFEVSIDVENNLNYELIAENTQCVGSFVLNVISGGQAPYTLTWHNLSTGEMGMIESQDGHFEVSNLSAGTYAISLTDSAVDMLTIVDSIEIETEINIEAEILFDAPNCAEDLIPVVRVEIRENGAIVTDPEDNGYIIDWNNGQIGNDTLFNVIEGWYGVTVIHEICADTIEVPVIEATAPPMINATTMTTAARCTGVNNGGIMLSVEGGTPDNGNYQIQWPDLNIDETTTAQSLSNLAAGDYTYIITDSMGCQLTDLVSIEVEKALSLIDTIQPLRCPQGSDAQIKLIANTSIDSIFLPYSFDWFWLNSENPSIVDTDTSSIISGLSADTCSVFLTDAEGCELEAEFIISELNFASAYAGQDSSTCKETFWLNANLPTGTIGEWSSSNPALIFSDSTSPQVLVENLQLGNNELIWTLSTDDCPAYHADTLYLNVDIPQLRADSYMLMLENEMGTLTENLLINDAVVNRADWTIIIENQPTWGEVAVDSTDLGAFTYIYTARNTAHEPNDQFTYALRHRTDSCSTDVALVQIQFSGLSDMPNDVITPNGDYINNYLVFPDSENYLDPEIRIYNRWGNLVYQKKPYMNNWYGVNQNGKNLPEGTYYYILEYNLLNNERQRIKGDITIVR